MSIFEPIAPETEPDPDGASSGRSFDPRAIQIAGLFTAGLVVLGLIVSNAAKPDHEPRPGLTSRVEPGAAAVEQVDLAPEPSPAPAESAEAPPDVVESDEENPPEPEATDADRDNRWGDSWNEDSWDELGDNPRKGNGNGFGHWRRAD